MTTDQSCEDMGCIKVHSQSPVDSSSENNETVVVYGSRPLRNAKTSYSASHFMPFAVLRSAKYLREYIE